MQKLSIIITSQINTYIVGETTCRDNELVTLKDPIVVTVKNGKLICDEFEGAEGDVTFNLRFHIGFGDLKKSLYPQVEQYYAWKRNLPTK